MKISSEMKLFGVILDNTLSFDQYIFSTAKQCNIHIKGIKHIRKSFTFQKAHNYAFSFIIPWLDYRDSLFYFLLPTLMKLQKLFNSQAIQMFSSRWDWETHNFTNQLAEQNISVDHSAMQHRQYGMLFSMKSDQFLVNHSNHRSKLICKNYNSSSTLFVFLSTYDTGLLYAKSALNKCE